MNIEINLYAVLAATVANMVVGTLWFGTFFRKQWLAQMGWDTAKQEEMKKGAMGAMAGSLVSSLVMAYVLGYLIALAGASNAIAGATIAFWIWLGFVATITLQSVFYEGRSLNLWLLNNGYNLVALLVMGAILAAWR